MAPIKVGIVGYGFGARNFHVPFIQAIPDYEITAIFQRSEAPRDPASAAPGSHCTVDFPNIKHYRKEEEFFADPDINLVVVVTRTDTHASFAEKALLAGKHGMHTPQPHVLLPVANSHSPRRQTIREIGRRCRPCYQTRREQRIDLNLLSEPQMG